MQAKRHPLQTEISGGKHLDDLDTSALVSTLVESQAHAIGALEKAMPAIDRAIEAALPVLSEESGRLIYCGAGTSGRVALLDAVELGPTFDWPPERMLVLLAGGTENFAAAQEAAEDDTDAARTAVSDAEVGATDVVVGIAASGTTPFVLECMSQARKRGATTIGCANNDGTPLLRSVDWPVLLDTGPEALPGSTRLTAGTSQKILMNVLSTALMVRLGRVYQGRMVSMRVSNSKLAGRAVTMVMDIAGCDEEAARQALEACAYDVKQAILVAEGVTPGEAAALLSRTRQRLDEAIALLKGRPSG
ncbi:N-acetylmuramic acid 6-phosphate etherase [Nitratireductor thuwali]|uniref:N-acetylmuramic acid 6-phosphate etherase n=1 Tax=Nitratireductor thuwali TaxID=2267699 RepID=A0ABY5MRE5_9HYPH|nr:N-acetylmuramic acid 6-phosphate etherase [Nitratireductor thuwali]